MPPAKPANITKVSLRLYDADIARVKRRAKEVGAMSWQDELRRIVHVAIDAPPPARGGQVYKFFIGPQGKDDPEVPGLTWAGMGAAAIAETEDEAREIVRTASAAVGRDARWLAVADVVILPCAPGTFIMQAWV